MTPPHTDWTKELEAISENFDPLEARDWEKIVALIERLKQEAYEAGEKEGWNDSGEHYEGVVHEVWNRAARLALIEELLGEVDALKNMDATPKKILDHIVFLLSSKIKEQETK